MYNRFYFKDKTKTLNKEELKLKQGFHRHSNLVPVRLHTQLWVLMSATVCKWFDG